MVFPGSMVLPAAWRTALQSIDAVLRHRGTITLSAYDLIASIFHLFLLLIPEYVVTIKTEQQEKQLKAQQSEKFKEEYGIRFIVEAKNSEIKNSYHLDRAISYGLDAYTMQGAVAFFTSNLVRITRIMDEMSEK